MLEKRGSSSVLCFCRSRLWQMDGAGCSCFSCSASPACLLGGEAEAVEATLAVAAATIAGHIYPNQIPNKTQYEMNFEIMPPIELFNEIPPRV